MSISQAETPMLVCGEQHRFLAAAQLADVGVKNASIILEPTSRNTAPALTLAALHATADGSDPIMLVMPSDHVMKDLSSFHAAVEVAYSAALDGRVITFGVVPNSPETGYGYIRYDPELGQDVHEVIGFEEKPKLEVAQSYIESGAYLWNSGIFMLRARVWLNAIEQARPEIGHLCRKSMLLARHDMDFIRPDPVVFSNCPSDSIDYAVMEKLPEHPEWGFTTNMVPLNAGWSDVGTWGAYWSESERDSQGNALIGDAVVQHGCNDSLLMSSGRLIVGVGLRDLIVVETSDAVLIVDKGCTQDVKYVVNRLVLNGDTTAQQHRKVHRPWGGYDLIDVGENFQVKRIVVKPGASLSLQMHEHRAEHWVVVNGVAEVTNEDKCFLLMKNESTYIPRGRRHRLRNPGETPLEIIEIQSGDYLGEDDIVRYEDMYGRLGSHVISR